MTMAAAAMIMVVAAMIMAAAVMAAQQQVQVSLYGRFPQVELSQIHTVQEMLLQQVQVHGIEALI